MEEQKKMVYEIIIDCWNVTKKHGFTRMDDKAWEDFIAETENGSQKWKGRGAVAWMLYRKIMNGLIEAVTALQCAEKGK